MPAKRRRPASGKTTDSLRADMPVAAILQRLPEAAPLLAEYGLHCFSCSQNDRETLAEGCRSHGFEETEISALVEDLNELERTRPPRPQTLAVTLHAAESLRDVLRTENATGQVLVVEVDPSGNFCLEFAGAAPDRAKQFGHSGVPEVIVAATPETLQRIGGATIDWRDGRFKLDLPGVAAAPSCSCSDGHCRCRKPAQARPKSS